MPLVLSNNVLLLYVQVANIRPRQTSGVVTTLTRNPPGNKKLKPDAHSVCAACSDTPCSEQCSLRCLNGSSAVHITKHDGSVSCSECLPLVTDINFNNDDIQTATHTAEPLVTEPSVFEVELAIEELKHHKSSGIDQIPSELIKAGEEQFAMRSINLLFLFAIRSNCLRSGSSRSLYLSIGRAIK